MDINIVNRVKTVLSSPKSLSNLNELKRLSFELCNYTMNLRCSDCINEAVFLLTNWIKQNNVDIDYKDVRTKAMNGEYYLKPINLFVQVYKSENEERQKELDACYLINHKSKFFNKVLTITERLTFKQMFDLSKEYPNDVNVFANSDIYFDETILNVRTLHKTSCLALSRWDIRDDNMCVLFDRKDSQDAWIFNGEVNCNGGDFYFGTRGCDNRIAYDLKQSGYTVLNPSKSIHAIHLHNTNFRTYNEKSPVVPEPYHFIFPHF